MRKVRTLAWAGRAGLGDLAVKWRGAAAWCAMVSLACVAMWNAGQGLSPEAKAASLAAAAARASVSGPEEASKLSAMMTPQALRKAMDDRAASGLDAALAASSATVEASAWTAKSGKDGQGWTEWGFATAKLRGPSGAGGSWSGAWRARVSRGAEGLRVDSLAMASLQEGAKLDASSLEALAEPSAQAPAALRLDASMAPVGSRR